jgi:hypothetical protein
VWRSVCVRGAGFPADTLLNLSAPASARAADDWMCAERRVSELAAEQRRLRRAARAAAETDPAAAAHAEAVACARHEAEARAAAARAALEQAFVSDGSRTSAYLRETACDPHFREAVLWQNRQAVHTGFEALLREADRSPGRRAQKERLVASYLQRYCAKNDTIGFFGPIGWARVADDGPAVRMVPGPRLVASRAVHFEGWAIDALARTLDRQPGMRPWLPPRLLPQVRVDGTRLLIPGREPATIAPPHARLLQRCDGRRSARSLARELAGIPSGGIRREADVYALLAAFEQMGLVIWSLQIPLERDPERTLRALVEQVGDPDVRVPCVAALNRLESCRQAVARAAGDVDALDGALATLESTFTALTSTGATRSPGEMYAGRTLVFEECRRDATIELGPELLDRCGPALSLLLDSARWCTSEIARRYRSELEAILVRLGATSGAALDLSAVLAEGPDLGGKGHIPAPIADVQTELRRRWMSVLAPQPDVRHARYGSVDLVPRVRAAFAATDAGWTLARHVSPDIMIAAAGVDAIARGEYVVVLGELHLLNTLNQATCLAEHPDRAELLRALDADCAAPTIVPVHTRDAFSGRTTIGAPPSRGFWYESSREIAPGPRDRVLRTSDLVVKPDVDGVWICARDGRARFDAIDFLGYFLALKCATMFGLLPDAPHMPRVTIDEVVVSRERWQAPARTLEWAWTHDPLERFLGARRWTEAHGIPRFAFAKAPVERKPCYVDFDSPVYVDTLAKIVKQSGESATPVGPITLTEMLPALDQLWLVDAQGRRYTTELRLVAADSRIPGRFDRVVGGLA